MTTGALFADVDLKWCRSQQAGKWSLADGDAIPMSVGEMDFKPHPRVNAAVVRAAEDVPSTYAPARGLSTLRAAVADLQRRLYGTRTQMEHVTVSGGTRLALATILQAILRPGDDLIVAGTPIYSHLLMGARLARARIRGVPLVGEQWELDQDRMRAVTSNRTRAILLNNPHNPTGKIFNPAELDLILACARRSDAWVIADEIFEHLILTGSHIPIGEVSPPYAHRCVGVSGFGKAFGIGGYRIAHIVHSGDIIERMERWSRQYVFVSSTLPQYAASACAEVFDEWIPPLRKIIRDNGAILRSQIMTQMPGVACQVPRATFFLWATARSGDLYRTFHEGLRIIPWSGSHFSPKVPNGIRLNVATSRRLVADAARRIRNG